LTRSTPKKSTEIAKELADQWDALAVTMAGCFGDRTARVGRNLKRTLKNQESVPPFKAFKICRPTVLGACGKCAAVERINGEHAQWSSGMATESRFVRELLSGKNWANK